MRVGVGVLTFDHIRTGRQDDFRRTWESIARTGHSAEIHLLTNGSTDGTEDVVRELGGIVDNRDNRIWYGITKLIEMMGDVDLIYLSADDIEYTEGWLGRLVSFIEDAPRDVYLFSALMEPVYDWNKPRQRMTCGGEVGLIRDSVCGSSWAFRRTDWEEWMGPLPDLQGQPGEDLLVCRKVRHHGRETGQGGGRIAALDLSEHIGEERSAWGNESFRQARPLDRRKWGLDDRNAEVASTPDRQ